MSSKKLLMQILTDKTSQGKVFKVDEPVIVDNVRKSSIALSFPSVTCNVCDVRSIEGYEAINEHIISAEHKRQIIDAGPVSREPCPRNTTAFELMFEQNPILGGNSILGLTKGEELYSWVCIPCGSHGKPSETDHFLTWEHSLNVINSRFPDVDITEIISQDSWIKTIFRQKFSFNLQSKGLLPKFEEVSQKDFERARKEIEKAFKCEKGSDQEKIILSEVYFETMKAFGIMQHCREIAFKLTDFGPEIPQTNEMVKKISDKAAAVDNSDKLDAFINDRELFKTFEITLLELVSKGYQGNFTQSRNFVLCQLIRNIAEILIDICELRGESLSAVREKIVGVLPRYLYSPQQLEEIITDIFGVHVLPEYPPAPYFGSLSLTEGDEEVMGENI